MTPDATEDGGNLYLRDTLTREVTLIATSPSSWFTAWINTHQGTQSIAYVDPEGKSVLFATGVPLIEGAPSAPPPYYAGAAPAYQWTPEGGLELVSVLPESEGGEAVYGFVGGYANGEIGARSGIPSVGGADHIYWMHFEEGAGVAGIYVRTGDETKPVSYSRLPGSRRNPCGLRSTRSAITGSTRCSTPRASERIV